MQRNLAARAGAWSAHHRRKAILGWIAFVILATVAGGMTGQQMLTDADTANGESRAAGQAIEDAGFPEQAGEQVLVQARGSLRSSDPAFVAALRDVTRRLDATRYVQDVRSPLSAGNEGQISKDGRSAVVGFEITGDDDVTSTRVDASLAAVAAAQAAHPGLRIEQFGDASADKALSKSFEDDFKRAEFLSVPITLLILILAFGAVVAAGLPLVLALTAVAGTLGLLGPVSQLLPVDESISSVVLLVGLAVGVDYCMFYLRREMEERDAGRGAEAALEAAAATSGRAVLISGVTVMVAMSGMFLAGNAVFESFAVGTILVVAVAIVGSLTVLPATLSWLGQKGWTEKGRVPYVAKLRHRTNGQSRVWGAIVDRVLRRPVLSIALSAGLMIALAIPALGMHTVNPGAAGLPRSLPIIQTYDRLEAAFPGGAEPAAVAIEAADVAAPAVQDAIAALKREAQTTPGLGQPVTVTNNPDNTLAIVDIPLAGNGTDAVSEAALARLREDVIPATIGRTNGVQANVTGMTAGSKDFNDTMISHLPIVFGFVLGLTFLLLLVTFRSIVIPIKAIVLNLLSVGASYGILKLVFQDGHGEKLLGFHSIGGITSWLPLFLFVILFGLSMDYHVFIVSRIREAVVGGMKTDQAVSYGIKQTAGVVTSAAVVMVAVFSIFATLSSLEFKQMGVGLAVAILIDATIVRAVLLPATMKLLGDWNWYLPSRLHWLPSLRHEVTPEPSRV
ncbi:MAG TPA: MMPL family transporter [Solirubrobacteraceae bacterium]|jgi:RND superfamily putative drug exporter|nr:MMPL family transporter [Solirubrobacteraceae bacterium]